ncbi:hypothetical protein Tco_1270635 [Tanacetum coccineum]
MPVLHLFLLLLAFPYTLFTSGHPRSHLKSSQQVSPIPEISRQQDNILMGKHKEQLLGAFENTHQGRHERCRMPIDELRRCTSSTGRCIDFRYNQQYHKSMQNEELLLQLSL